jgi:prephenate dehydrogenase
MSCLVALRTNEDARTLVGSGWRDITRVAAGDPSMWTAICKENRAAIAKELSGIGESLQQLCEMIGESDDKALERWLADAKKVREKAAN